MLDLRAHCEVFETNFYDGEKHLSGVAPAPKDGRYFMFNVGTGRFLDVSGSQLQDGIDILVWSENKPATTNQQWDFIRQSSEGYICTFQAAHSNGYVKVSGVRTKIADAPYSLLQSSKPVVWQLIPHGKDQFKLKPLAGEQGFVLCSEDDTKQSKAQLKIDKPDDVNQLWEFRSPK